jgi:hypothetical protein
MDKSTIYRLARGDNIPAHKYDRIWRFDAAELDGSMKSEESSAIAPNENSERD